MEVKKLEGLTYQQWHALSPEEIRSALLKYVMDQVLGAMSASGEEPDEDFLEKFIPSVTKGVQEFIQEAYTVDFLTNARKLYDTEERFNIAADMNNRMGNVGIRTQHLVRDIVVDYMRKM